MRYAIAIVLMLLTTKGAVMIIEGLSSLQTDYRFVPQYASAAIERLGAEAYLAQLMIEHEGYLRSMYFGAVLVIASIWLWRWWHRRYFVSVSAK